MVSSITLNASRKKQEKREGEVRYMEDKLGKSEDHPEDTTYTHASPAEIVANLKSRKDKWTVERVMIAFIRAACAAHRKTNCLTEVMFREALKDAKLKDRELAISNLVEGAFWGLPSSFKDTYNICGVDSSLGLSQFCDDPTTDMEDEAGIVKVFRKAGGIPFCKTNVPQLLFAIECSNPIFGTTTNLYDSTRTSGGSSGGEASIVSLRGTPLGWGSDVGGSLRVPAHYTGCCALKPMRGRWPHCGQRSCVKGADGVKVVEGPMARNVDDLIFASSGILSLVPEMSDSFNGESLMPIPWIKVELPKKLKIGYFVELPGVKTSPACARAVNETVKKLQAAGHEIVPFAPPLLIDAFRSFAAMTSADGYQTLLGNLGPDAMEPSLRLVTLGSLMPRFIHWLVVQLLLRVLRDVLFASIFAVSRPKPVKDLWLATHLRNECSAAFSREAWDKAQFDAVICPVITVPALEHGRTTLLAPVAVGTIIFNIIDSTVGALPVTRVDAELDALPPDFLKDSKGSWLLEKRVYAGSDPAYDAKKMHGLPVGIQVVGKPWEDEKVLGVMKVVESAVGLK